MSWSFVIDAPGKNVTICAYVLTAQSFATVPAVLRRLYDRDVTRTAHSSILFSNGTAASHPKLLLTLWCGPILGREGGHGIAEYMNTKLIAFGGI